MEGGGVAGPQMLAPSLAGPPGVPPPTSVPVPRFFHTPRFSTPAAPGKHVYPPRNNFQQSLQAQGITYDGKRMRNKAVLRRTVDYNTSLTNYIENRVWHRDYRDMHALQTDNLYTHCMIPPMALAEHAMNGVTTKFVRTSTNKIRCPIFCVCWTPEGRRLITGASSGEFTLWNGLTFNFETILQAHDVSVRSMIWSHNDQWMLTGDHAGFVKYWQSNMNNVKMYQSHKDPVRGLSFCPTDQKYASCSDDGTVRVWDFLRCHEERILRGHGADVKCVDWHPQKALIASGSKDTQQPVKLWDPRTGNSLATVHAHKHTVMSVQWNRNGNWLLTASRDHLVKLFDIRNMKEELQIFKGHKKEATTVAWHPVHEDLFASGGSEGSILFWLVGCDKEVGGMDEAHDMMVWSLAWHPLGHILVSGSNDHTTKFWTRNRPGDAMRDKYNLNTMPLGMTDEAFDYDGDTLTATLPGMGFENLSEQAKGKDDGQDKLFMPSIPGLDMDGPLPSDLPSDAAHRQPKKKTPYAKPVPKSFQEAWSTGKQPPIFSAAAAAAQQERHAADESIEEKPEPRKQDRSDWKDRLHTRSQQGRNLSSQSEKGEYDEGGRGSDPMRNQQNNTMMGGNMNLMNNQFGGHGLAENMQNQGNMANSRNMMGQGQNMGKQNSRQLMGNVNMGNIGGPMNQRMMMQGQGGMPGPTPLLSMKIPNKDLSRYDNGNQSFGGLRDSQDRGGVRKRLRGAGRGNATHDGGMGNDWQERPSSGSHRLDRSFEDVPQKTSQQQSAQQQPPSLLDMPLLPPPKKRAWEEGPGDGNQGSNPRAMSKFGRNDSFDRRQDSDSFRSPDDGGDQRVSRGGIRGRGVVRGSTPRGRGRGLRGGRGSRGGR